VYTPTFLAMMSCRRRNTSMHSISRCLFLLLCGANRTRFALLLLWTCYRKHTAKLPFALDPFCLWKKKSPSTMCTIAVGESYKHHRISSGRTTDSELSCMSCSGRFLTYDPLIQVQVSKHINGDFRHETYPLLNLISMSTV
jgi:hypothetical protein